MNPGTLVTTSNPCMSLECVTRRGVVVRIQRPRPGVLSRGDIAIGWFDGEASVVESSHAVDFFADQVIRRQYIILDEPSPAEFLGTCLAVAQGPLSSFDDAANWRFGLRDPFGTEVYAPLHSFKAGERPWYGGELGAAYCESRESRDGVIRVLNALVEKRLFGESEACEHIGKNIRAYGLRRTDIEDIRFHADPANQGRILAPVPEISASEHFARITEAFKKHTRRRLFEERYNDACPDCGCAAMTLFSTSECSNPSCKNHVTGG